MEEAKSSKVKVLSVLSVVSGKPTEPGKVHNFSLLDQAMGLHTIHVVFYYRSNPFIDGPMSSDLDNLRVTLSLVLDQYPVVTGRLVRDGENGLKVKCNDAGVRMLEAAVSVTLDEWLRSADEDEERDLTVWKDMPLDPSFWSPFRIQINKFKCGGLAIGLSCIHMHADITSVTMLIKSWTEVHRGQSLTHPPIFHLPSPVSSPNNSTPLFIAPKDSKTPSKLSTVTMKFSSSSIQNCLSQVQNQCPKATPFDVLVALYWSRIAHCQDIAPEDHKHHLSVCVDLRHRGHSPIPINFFGNALNFSLLSVDTDELMSDGLGQVADYVHTHIEGIKDDDLWAVMSQLESLKKDGKGPYRMYGPRLTCVSMEHMMDAETGEALIYDAVFKERPVHVSYHVGNVEGEGLITVMPSPEAGLGRIVKVNLPEAQITKLCKDQRLLDLNPLMLLSGTR